MKERFLFDRVDMRGGKFAVNEAYQLSILVLSYSADTSFARCNIAEVRAEGTFNSAGISGRIVGSFMHSYLN